MSSIKGKITQKLKQVKYRHLAKFLNSNLKEDPNNCVHNISSVSDTGFNIFICGYEAGEDSPYGVICDSRFDGINRAKNCKLFCPKKSKQQLKEEYHNFFEVSSVSTLAHEFPDVMALTWVLNILDGDEDLELELDLEELARLKHFEKNMETWVIEQEGKTEEASNTIQLLEKENAYLQEKISILEGRELKPISFWDWLRGVFK